MYGTVYLLWWIGHERWHSGITQLYAMQEDGGCIQLHGIVVDHSASAFYCRMSLQLRSLGAAVQA